MNDDKETKSLKDELLEVLNEKGPLYFVLLSVAFNFHYTQRILWKGSINTSALFCLCPYWHFRICHTSFIIICS